MLRGFCLVLLQVTGAADESMTFLAMGDWGGKNDREPTTSAEIKNAEGMAAVATAAGGIRFVLAQGDNFYMVGLRGDDHCQRFIDGFENEFAHPALQVPFYVIAGNHDHLGNVSAQVAYTHDSKRWTYPDLWYNFKQSFTSSEGKEVTTEIVQIDTVTLSGMSYDDDFAKYYPHPMQAHSERQMEWLEKVMAASTADYLWIGGHYPMYSQCPHGPSKKMASLLLPLMRKYKASGYIYGHDHCLAHYTQEDMAFVLIGAGARELHNPKNMHNRANAGSLKFRMDKKNRMGVAGFASFTATSSGTTIKYHNEKGEELYTAEAVKPRSGSPSPPSPVTWDCYQGRYSTLGGDVDLGYEGDRSACELQCQLTSGCGGINWHAKNNHCHMKMGNWPRSSFENSLRSQKSWDSCWVSVPPSPVPPSPVPTPSPAPNPGTWNCYDGRYSRLDGDVNLHYYSDISVCESQCQQRSDCKAINWHKKDKHCHIKVGSWSRGSYEKSLIKHRSWGSCWAPAPVARDCYDGQYSHLDGDFNLHYYSDISVCESQCQQRSGCKAINWHKKDKHCHIKVGNWSRTAYANSFITRRSWQSCWVSVQDRIDVVV